MVTISKRQKKPFKGIAGNFGVESDESVRGVVLPVEGRAYYASLVEGHWRYWIRRQEDEGRSAESFADAVGRLLPMRSKAFVSRLNDHASGPIQPTFFSRPSGDAVIYDLEDKQIVERFALACSVGEALSRAQRVISLRPGQRPEQATILQDALPQMNTNLSLWAVDAPQQSLVFLPNAVLLRRERYQWVVPFTEIAVRFELEAHGADENTPTDVGMHPSGRLVTFGEIRLALSDQRVKLQVSNPECAKQAAAAIQKLIEFAPRQRRPLGPESEDIQLNARRRAKKKRPQRREEPRVRRRGPRQPGLAESRGTSVGRIVIKSREEQQATSGPKISIAPRAAGAAAAAAGAAGAAASAAEGIVVRVKVGPDAGERPAPDNEDGLPTPRAAADDEDLIFCDDSGLVFATECFMSEEGPDAPPPGEGGGDLSGLNLSNVSPTADPCPQEEAAAALADQIRGAVGALMAYVANADDGFTAAEQALIRQILQLPRGFHLERRFAAIRPGSQALGNACSFLRGQDAELRRRVLSECERVAWADDQVTRDEHGRLAEIKQALGI